METSPEKTRSWKGGLAGEVSMVYTSYLQESADEDASLEVGK